MALIARIIKTIITLATLVTSVEAIVRLAKFAWALVLQLFKARGLAQSFAATGLKLGFGRA